MHHDFQALPGFFNQGALTSCVSGAVHKHADSVPGVIEEVFRALFRAIDSQVLISQFPSFSSGRLYPKLP